MFMYGGRTIENIVLEDLWRFDLEKAAWRQVMVDGDVPGPRFSHSLSVLLDHLVLLGGCPAKNSSAHPAGRSC